MTILGILKLEIEKNNYIHSRYARNQITFSNLVVLEEHFALLLGT